MLRARTVSLAVAYLMLIIATFVAEAILTTAFIGSVYMSTSYLPSVVEGFGSGVVYGAYAVGPVQYRVGNRVINTYALYISLVNPNPMPVEVVLVTYITGQVPSEKVVDLLSIYNAEFTYRDRGVEIVRNSPRWFPDAKNYLYMPPHTAASLTVPIYSMVIAGTPSDILACTKMGCTKLGKIGEIRLRPSSEEPWVITSRGIGAGSNEPFNIPVQWTWSARTWVGYMYVCGPRSGTITLANIPFYAQCCMKPPSDYPYFICGTSNKRGYCNLAEGSMPSFSTYYASPNNVIAGFYVTDTSFDFKTPEIIRIGRYTYRLYGLSMEPGVSTWYLIPGEWRDYTGTSCLDREITITIRITPNTAKSSATFADVLPKSTGIYVYVAAKGYSSSSWIPPSSETDKIDITISYKVGNTLYPLPPISSSDGYVDNSAGLASRPNNWMIDINANEIVITISYRMSGPTNMLSGACFTFINECGSGSGSDRNVRLAFYIELIPSEYLS